MMSGLSDRRTFAADDSIELPVVGQRITKNRIELDKVDGEIGQIIAGSDCVVRLTSA
jgi:hypothetical protein